MSGLKHFYSRNLAGDGDGIPSLDETECFNAADADATLSSIEAHLAGTSPPENAGDMAELFPALEGIVVQRRDDPDFIKFFRRERYWIKARLNDLDEIETAALDHCKRAITHYEHEICTATFQKQKAPAEFRRALSKLHETDPEKNRALIHSLKHAYRNSLEQLPADRRKKHLHQWLENIEHRVDHVRSQEESSRLLSGLLLEINELEDCLCYFKQSKLGRRARKLKKKLRHEYREARFKEKMTGLIGKRGERLLNSFILALIFLMVALFFIEFRFDPSEKTQQVFMYIDTGICFCFLADFVFRLSLAGPWYFPSHALFEFLPAIPFSLLFSSQLALFDSIKSLRFVALLTRGTRAPMILRPLVRSFRFSAFLMGGLDRIVRQLRPLFDYDIHIGLQSEERADTSSPPERKVRQLQNQYSYQVRVYFRELSPYEGRRFLLAYLSLLAAVAGKLSENAPALRPGTGFEGRTITIGRIASQLRSLDPVQVEVDLGSWSTERLASALAYFNIVPFKYLPFFRDLARAGNCRDSATAVCQAAGAVSVLAEKAEALIHVFADFRGVGTGPQLLDRFASMVVKTARRYATRLLITGTLFVFVTLLVNISGISMLAPVAAFFQKILGIPIIVLGFFSTLVLCGALYLQRLAGEAIESWHKTAEAQFINLGTEEKALTSRDDRGFLSRRVLNEEEKVLGNETDYARKQLEMRKDKVDYLYRDWLSGAMLHKSDIKLAEQLLGNIAIQQLRGCSLHESASQRRQREKRSLAAANASLFKPLFYFRLVVDTLSVETAKLIVEYNRAAVPLTELPHLTDEERAQYNAWIGQEAQGRRQRGSLPWNTEFRTTFFTARHFLSPHPAVLESITQHFGESVTRRLRRDRVSLIKEIFGLWPLNLGDINPYLFYQRYCASFRILLLPLRLLWWSLKGLCFVVKRTSFLLQEIRGTVPPAEVNRNVPAPFSVARRKIVRIRQGMLEEATQLRAMIDPQFLGIEPLQNNKLTDEAPGKKDLEYFEDASGMNGLLVRKRKRAHGDAVRFQLFLKEEGWDGHSFAQAARILCCGHHSEPCSNPEEVVRACFLAYCLNWHNCKVNLHAEKIVMEFFGRLRRHAQPEMNLLPRLRIRLLVSLKLFRKKNRCARSLYRSLLHLIPEKKLHSQLLPLFLSAEESIINAASLVIGHEPLRRSRYTAGRRELQKIALTPSFWSDHLITIRTLQSIAILDIMTYVRMVYALGEYDKVEGKCTQ